MSGVGGQGKAQAASNGAPDCGVGFRGHLGVPENRGFRV